ncbi:MAG TPA: hypothetical protein PL045_09840 [Chitinophagaceae bacterium]|nr:hypothetical protein [Chitinophagaceae bacterium]
MKKTLLTAGFFFTLLFAFAQKPVQVGDCTIIYSIAGDGNSANKDLSDAAKTVYVKGKMIRSDAVSPTYNQTILYNGNDGTAVILQQSGAEKYMTKFSAEDWKEKNKRYEGSTASFSNETKTILTYECKKATVTLKDGSNFVVYYAPGISTMIQENPFQFKDIPGIVLQYTLTDEGKSITYTAIKLNFNPVPAMKFEIPAAGYRVLKP